MYGMNRVGLFLQVRLNSSRMPGKALMKLSGKSLIQHAMERLMVVPADVRVLLTTKESSFLLSEFADEMGWEVFTGDSENVLLRFIEAARFYKVDTIIRATGDNPLSSSEIAIETLTLFKTTGSDLSYLNPVPYGSGVEVVKTEALQRALSLTEVPYDLEHVTPYIHNNTDKFVITTAKYHNADVARSDIRVTVDTRTDFEKMNYFFRILKKKKFNHTIQALVGLWDEIDFIKYRRVLFVTAGGDSFGLGHLKRALYLSNFFKNDFEVFFTLKHYHEDAARMIQKEGHDIIEYDMLQKNIADDGVFDRVIVDLRDTTVEEMDFFNFLGPTISVDDMGEGGQNSYINIRTLPSLTNKNYKFNYDGLEFLFIDRQSYLNKILKKDQSGEVNKVLISFGGSDPLGMTVDLLRNFVKSEYLVSIIVGPFFKHIIEEKENIKLIYSPESIKEHIAESDLIITSFGMTFMEALLCGKPVIIINPSEYHDRLTENFGYPYLIKFSDDRAGKSINILVNDMIEKMKNDGVFIQNSSLKPFYELPYGKSFDSIINTILKSQPSSVVCPYCSSQNLNVISRSNLWNMHKCKKCDLIFTDIFNVDELPNYDKDYFLEEYENHYGRTYEDDREQIRELAIRRVQMINKFKKKGRLLDYGSGLGFFAEYCEEKGFRTTSVDISTYATDYIKNNLRLDAVNSDEDYLVNGDDKFDIITSFYLIEHVHDFNKLLFLFKMHLNTNGVLCLSTPNARGVSISKHFDDYLSKHPIDHFYIFSPSFMKRALKKMGFKKIKVRITGIHPERMTNSQFILNNKFCVKIIHILSKIFQWGDTFEIYGQKK